MIANMHGVQLYPSMDMCLQDAKRTGGLFEPETFELFRAFISAGAKLFFDVGAYSGLYSIYAAKAGLISIAFEPNKVLYNRILSNAELNIVNITVHNKAVSNRRGISAFYYNFDCSSAGSLYKSQKLVTEVELMTLDELSLEPCIIKIDVEGGELDVLRGALATLRTKPKLIIEALSSMDRERLRHFLEPLGYTSFIQCDDRNLVIT